jgi:hypothetical protein
MKRLQRIVVDDDEPNIGQSLRLSKRRMTAVSPDSPEKV